MSNTHQNSFPGSPLASPASWDKGAAGWNANAEFIHTWLQDITTMMLDAARIGPGSKVLDIAAGSGDQTLAIARRVGEHGYVLATDFSDEFLALAQNNLIAAGFHHVKTQIADAQALGLAGANFDAAVCRLGLMYCADPKAALIEARSALRSGGRFSAVVFSHPKHNPCVTMSMAIARKHTGRPAQSSDTPIGPGNLFSLGEPGLLAQMLEAAGFDDIDVRSVSAPHRLASVRQYVDFVRSGATPIIEMLASLYAREQNDAWDELERRLEIFTTDTGWEGPNELLLCSASAT